MWQAIVKWLREQIRSELNDCPTCGKTGTGGDYCSAECWQAQLH